MTTTQSTPDFNFYDEADRAAEVQRLLELENWNTTSGHHQAAKLARLRRLAALDAPTIQPAPVRAYIVDLMHPTTKLWS